MKSWPSKWSGVCTKCSGRYQRGDQIASVVRREGGWGSEGRWVREPGKFRHAVCPAVESPQEAVQVPLPLGADPETGEIVSRAQRLDEWELRRSR